MQWKTRWAKQHPKKGRIGMQTLKKNRLLFLVTLTLLGFVGCEISKEENEKVVSQLEKTTAQLAEAKASLELANAKVTEMEKLLAQVQGQLRIAREKQTRTRQVLRASLADSQRETTILRQQLDELMQRVMQLSRELDITKQANEVLKEKINTLTYEKNRQKEGRGWRSE